MPIYNANFNHFTGKTKPFHNVKRKKNKNKRKKTHKNKYERFSQGNQPPYTFKK